MMHICRRIRFQSLKLTDNIFKLPVDYSRLLFLDLHRVSLKASLFVKLLGMLKQIEVLHLDIDETDDLDEAKKQERIDVPSLKSLEISDLKVFFRHIGRTGIKKLRFDDNFGILGKLKYLLDMSKPLFVLL
jgi:hypothetical protein